jgi:hypothetical protein
MLKAAPSTVNFLSRTTKFTIILYCKDRSRRFIYNWTYKARRSINLLYIPLIFFNFLVPHVLWKEPLCHFETLRRATEPSGRHTNKKNFLTDPVTRQGWALILCVMDPRIGLRQLPRLISRVEGLRHSQRHRLRHFSLRAEKCVALHRLVEIRRDEREHVIVRRVRRAIRNPEVKE